MVTFDPESVQRDNHQGGIPTFVLRGHANLFNFQRWGVSQPCQAKPLTPSKLANYLYLINLKFHTCQTRPLPDNLAH
jgi:hypothetical protein